MHVDLSQDESQHIRDLVVKASVFGDRWPVEHRLGLFADTPPLEGWKKEEREQKIMGKVIIDQE
jgi:hypothetical protein